MTPGGGFSHDADMKWAGWGQQLWFPATWSSAVLLSLLVYFVLLFIAACTLDLFFWVTLRRLDTRGTSLTVVIPALNEGQSIAATVRMALELDPPALEVIVVDGGSTDSTVVAAKEAGATVLELGKGQRGRARQMNAGAEAATGQLLCFLHADTAVPQNLVHVIRQAFSDPRTVLTGLLPSIVTTKGKTMRALSAHHVAKTYYCPAVFEPIKFVKGLRILFGDQTICCRAADFAAVGGFKGELPIMEDADLCIRLNQSGPSSSQRPGTTHRGYGRIKMLLSSTSVTSGRRLEAWGSWYSTWVHIVIMVRWYFWDTPADLHKLYKRMYTDKFRSHQFVHGLMGTSGSKSLLDKEEQYLQKLETEAVRAALPRGLIDEKGNQLKYELHYCLTRNDWWFTIGGILIGGFLSWRWRAVQPIAAAAILAPGLDWMYSQNVCAEQQEAYQSHKAKLMQEYRQSAEEVKQRIRKQHADAMQARQRGEA